MVQPFLIIQYVVADSCETFLRDSRLFDKLLNLKEKDKSLFEKTKEYISKLFDKVAALRHKYKSFTPDSKEGNIVTQMTDTIEQLHRLWEDAALTALENSRRASGTAKQKNTAENGGEVKQSQRLGGYYPDIKVSTKDISIFGIKDINDIKEVKYRVYNYLLGKYVSNDKISKPIKNIDTGMDIYIYKGGIDETFGNTNAYKNLYTKNKKVKLATMTSLAKLIKYGEVRSPEAPNLYNSKSKNTYAYLTAPIVVDGVAYTVNMDIKKTQMGNRFYVHTIKIASDSPRSDNSQTKYSNRLHNEVDQILPRTNSASGIEKSTSKSSIRNHESNVKQKQLEIIQQTNPMWDDYHTGIRTTDDIHTWAEVLRLNDEHEGQFVWGDFSRADAEKALKDGTITVYSSYPIKNGVFVSTSYIQAQEYAGGRNGKVYSKTIPLTDVAWINGDEGQYAKVGEAQKNTTEKGGEVVRLSQRDNSDNSIKDQLKANLNILNSMETVASIQEFKTFEYKQQTLDWVLKRLENTGYKVNRKGFGEIIIDKKRLKSGLSYSKTNEEKLGFAVLPQVLAKGVEIDTHIKHKNRAYDTVTFAAPVVINGQRGNMAVVVRQEGKNYYKVHRLVMPDGSQFILNKKRDTAETAGGVDNNSGLSPTDNVSKNNIPDLTEKVNNNVKKSDRDVRYSLRDYSYENRNASDYYSDSIIYTYDFLVSQKDMKTVALPATGTLSNAKGKIDDAKVLSEGKKNILSVGIEKNGKTYVKNLYTNRELRIDNSTIKHGLSGTYNRHLTNARIASVIGSVVQNAIPINALKNTSAKAEGTYAMVAYCRDNQNREFIAVVTVEQHTNNIDSFELYDVAHAVSGRQKNGSQVDTKSQGVYPIKATTVSIADLLMIVNDTHQSILSDDVLSRLGQTRNPDGAYSNKVLFSDRDPAFVSDRELLADALMSAVVNDGEYKILDDYKKNIKKMYSEQQKLDNLNEQIKELTFTSGRRNSDELRRLRDEVTKTRNRISVYDKKLLRLEAAAPLRELLKREKRAAEKKQKEIDAEILKNAKEQLENKNREELANYKDSLKRTEMRRKIRHVISMMKRN